MLQSHFASGFEELLGVHKHLLRVYLEHYFSKQKIQGVNELFCINIPTIDR